MSLTVLFGIIYKSYYTILINFLFIYNTFNKNNSVSTKKNKR